MKGIQYCNGFTLPLFPSNPNHKNIQPNSMCIRGTHLHCRKAWSSLSQLRKPSGSMAARAAAACVAIVVGVLVNAVLESTLVGKGAAVPLTLAIMVVAVPTVTVDAVAKVVVVPVEVVTGSAEQTSKEMHARHAKCHTKGNRMCALEGSPGFPSLSSPHTSSLSLRLCF